MMMKFLAGLIVTVLAQDARPGQIPRNLISDDHVNLYQTKKNVERMSAEMTVWRSMNQACKKCKVDIDKRRAHGKQKKEFADKECYVIDAPKTGPIYWFFGASDDVSGWTHCGSLKKGKPTEDSSHADNDHVSTEAKGEIEEDSASGEDIISKKPKKTTKTKPVEPHKPTAPVKPHKPKPVADPKPPTIDAGSKQNPPIVATLPPVYHRKIDACNACAEAHPSTSRCRFQSNDGTYTYTLEDPGVKCSNQFPNIKKYSGGNSKSNKRAATQPTEEY